MAASAVGCSRGAGAAAAIDYVRITRVTIPRTVVAAGAVRPEVGAEVRVGPRISGVLDRLLVQVGDIVHKNDVLAELDHRDLDIAVEAEEAAVAELECQCALLRRVRARRETLAARGLLAVEDLEQARQTQEEREAQLAAARARLKAAVERQSYAVLRAPISGSVTSIATREGETVASSFAVPTFVTIMDLDRLQVEALVDEVDIGGVKTGQTASFTVDSFPEEQFRAVVRAVVPQAVVRNNVVNYTVVLRITGGRRSLLRPDMTAAVTIDSGTTIGALVLPRRAVHRGDNGTAFVGLREGDRTVQREISLGDARGDDVLVRGGLSEGSVVEVPRALTGEQER